MESAKSTDRVLIAAGGTGGHLYPGLAVARSLAQRGITVLFVVRRGDMGKELLKRDGFHAIRVSGQGLPRSLSWKLITFPIQLIQGFFQAWYILKEFQPRGVLGMGGYLTFPVVVAAWLQGIPTLIHEQNSRPGMSNRLLSRIACSVAVSFPESAGYFPARKVWVSGMPVRPEISGLSQEEGRRRFNLSGRKITFLVFGGSQGALHLNQTLLEAWSLPSAWMDRVQVLHITGEAHYAQVEEAYRGLPVQAVVLPYCHAMAAAYAAADLVISRAGASTVAELITARRPALLVPFPWASGNHQFYNAEVLVRKQVADLIADADFTPALATRRLAAYAQDPRLLEAMKRRYADWTLEAPPPQAAARLADRLTHSGR